MTVYFDLSWIWNDLGIMDVPLSRIGLYVAQTNRLTRERPRFG